MKAILIDPFNETITEVDSDGGLESIYALTQTTIVEVAPIDVADSEEQDTIYVDEEGLLGDLSKQKFFFSEDLMAQPLAGRGIVFSTDDEGDSAPPRSTVEALRASIKFYDLNSVRELME